MDRRGKLSRLASGSDLRPAGNEPRFPVRSLSGALALSVLVCVWIGWSGYHSHKTEQAMRIQQFRYEQLHGNIVYLDEVLTMSARMAAATGDSKWETRYLQYEPRLRAAVSEIGRLTPERPAIAKAVDQIHRANLELVNTERRAFSLITAGKTERARELLISREYEDQKRVFADSIDRVVRLVADETRLAGQSEKRALRLAVTGGLLAVSFMLFAWAVTMRRLFRWRTDLSAAVRGRAAEAALRRGAEDALSESESRYCDLVETAQDLIWQCDTEGRYTFLNPAWEKVMGYSVEEMLGRPFTDFQSPECGDRDRFVLQQILAGEIVTEHETVHITRDGREVSLVFSGRLVRDADGQPVGTRGTAYDITRRKNAEAALHESRALLSEAERIAHLGSWKLDLGSGRLRWSDEVFRIFGLPVEEDGLTYETFLERVHPGDRATVDAAYSKSVRDGADGYEIEHRIVKRDTGEIRHVHERCFNTRGADGQVVSSTGFVHDITERRRAEETVRRRRRQLEAIHEVSVLASKGHRLEDVMNLILDGALNVCGTTVGMIFIRDVEARTLDMVASRGLSDGFVQEFKDRTIVDGEGLTGRIAQTGQTIYIERDSSHDPRIERMVINEEGLNSFIGVPITAEGETVTVMNILTRPPQTLSEDDVSLVQAVASFVGPAVRNARLFSDLERVQEEVRRLNERFEISVRAANLGVWDWNIPENELIWDEGMYSLYGVSREDFAGAYEAWRACLHPEDRDEAEKVTQRTLDGEEEYDTEFRIIRPDGEVRTLKAHGLVTRDAAGKPLRMVGINSDITKRRGAEEALKRSEEHLRQVLDSTPFPVAVVDMQDNRILYWSQSAIRLLGHTAPTTEEWYRIAYPDPEYRQQVVARWKPFLEEARQSRTPVNTGEYRVTCEDGSVRVCELYANFIPGNLIVTFNDVNERKTAEAEILRLNEELEARVEERTAELNRSVEALHAEAAERSRAQERIRALNDSLERQAQELRVANRHLQNALDKTEAAERVKSAFLAAMSHELRTPLNSVIGFTGAMLEGLAGEVAEEQREFLEIVERNGRHLLALINDVLDLSKLEAGQMRFSNQPLDLAELTRETTESLRPQAEAKGLTLSVEGASTTLPYTGDRRRIAQVLLNLLSNAVKFTEQGGVTIRLPADPGAAHVDIMVIDTGIGIFPTDLERIFMEFEQIESASARDAEGTGLGLSLSRKLARLMGGDLLVESTRGEGSTFILRLPCQGGGA